MEYPYKEWQKYGFSREAYVNWRYVFARRNLMTSDHSLLSGLCGTSRSQLLRRAYAIAKKNNIEVPLESYFTPEQAADWSKVFYDPREAFEWFRWGFTPSKAVEFQQKLGKARKPHSCFIIAVQPISLDEFIKFRDLLNSANPNVGKQGTGGSAWVTFVTRVVEWACLHRQRNLPPLSEDSSWISSWMQAVGYADRCKQYLDHFDDDLTALKWAGLFAHHFRLAKHCSEYCPDPDDAWHKIPTFDPDEVEEAFLVAQYGTNMDHIKKWNFQTNNSGLRALLTALEDKEYPLVWKDAESQNHHLLWYADESIRRTYPDPSYGTEMILLHRGNLKNVMKANTLYGHIEGIDEAERVRCLQLGISPEIIEDYLKQGVLLEWAIENER